MPTVVHSTARFHISITLQLQHRFVCRGFRMQILSVKFTIKNWHHNWYFVHSMQLQWKLLQWIKRNANDLQQMSTVFFITDWFHIFNALCLLHWLVFRGFRMQIMPIKFTIENWHHTGHFIDSMYLQRKLLPGNYRRTIDLQQMSSLVHGSDRFHIPNTLRLQHWLVRRGFIMQIMSVKFTIKNHHHKWYFVNTMRLQWKLLQWTE